jgi:hypothetical protein
VKEKEPRTAGRDPSNLFREREERQRGMGRDRELEIER